MPMYEYDCRTCTNHFDRLRRMDQSDEGVTCPNCGGAHVERRLSVFAAHSRSSSGATLTTSAPVATGGGCGGGCCGGTCASRN